MRFLLTQLERVHILYIATFLFLLTCVAYGNTLGNQLFFDDEDFIYKNVHVQQFATKEFFTNNLIAGAGKISNYYRPVLGITYSIIYQLTGANGTLYHLVSLLCHAAAGIALFLVLRRLLGSQTLPLFVSILFIIHPLQTEAVAYASGISDPLSVFFMMVTLLFFLQGTRRSKYISYIIFVVALLTRETAIVLPGLLFAIFFFQTKSVLKACKEMQQTLVLIGIALCYIVLRLTLLNFQNTLNFFPVPTAYSTHLSYRLLTFLAILPEYIRLLFYPNILNIERDVTPITSFFHLPSLFTAVVLGLALFFSFRFRKKYPVFLFSFLWFFVTIAPTTGIIPINGIMYEHFLYLPLVGIFLPLGFSLIRICKKTPTLVSGIIISVLGVGMIFFLVRTIQRNADWHDPIRFYTKTISINPNSARIYNNLAMSYSDTQQYPQAIKTYKAAIALNDVYPETHYNLGNAYVAVNDLPHAEQEYQKALTINPLFLRGYTNLVSIYKYLGKDKEKEETIQRVEKLAEKNESLLQFVHYLRSI